MAQPFSAVDAGKQPGRLRRTRATTKWEAAKEAVLNEIGSLQPEDRVVVLAFNSTTELIFDGSVSNLDRLSSALASINPQSGTDLAVALHAVNEHIRDYAAQHIAVQIISDGLTDLPSAREAAQDVERVVAQIGVILIDPTQEGLAVANAVVQRGKVEKVGSDTELAAGLSAARQLQDLERERVTEALARVSTAGRAVVERIPSQERLSITVGYPGSPAADVWYSLVTYLHVPVADPEVNKRLAARSREAGQRVAVASSRISAMRGTWFTLVPSINEVEFNPPRQEVAWVENIQEIAFRFRAETTSEGKPLVGAMEVLANNLPVGVVPLALQVGGTSWSDSSDQWATSSALMFQHVFASYSRNDLDIVKACAEAYSALGIDLFVDRKDLLAGQEWHPALLQKIEEIDVFQLFWSNSSRESRYVDDEWRHAMSMRRQKGHRFLRPLYWEEPKPDAPAELNKLNFSFLDVDTLSRARSASTSINITENAADKPLAFAPDHDAKELSSESLVQRANGINAAVIPLVVGEVRQELANIRTDVGRVVAFLEHLTGLRYYPVPTLLVDEFGVRQARAAQRLVDTVTR